MTPVLLGPVTHPPEGVYDDAAVAAAHVEMKVRNCHGLQLRPAQSWSLGTLWAKGRDEQLQDSGDEARFCQTSAGTSYRPGERPLCMLADLENRMTQFPPSFPPV